MLPVLYLNSDVSIVLGTGDGSSGNPYRISLRWMVIVKKNKKKKKSNDKLLFFWYNIFIVE